MRGYNESQAPGEVSAYALGVLAADVFAMADASGAERMHLVGHDGGAVVAWWIAARHADRLDRVVVMDGPYSDVWGRQARHHPTEAVNAGLIPGQRGGVNAGQCV